MARTPYFTPEIKNKIVSIVCKIGIQPFIDKYNTLDLKTITSLLESNSAENLQNEPIDSTLKEINDSKPEYTSEDIDIIAAVVTEYGIKAAVEKFNKLRYRTVYDWMQNEHSINTSSSAQIEECVDNNLPIIVRTAKKYNTDEIHRPLYIRELTKLVGFTHEEMTYFIINRKNNTNMLFRSDSPYVVRNLELINPKSPLFETSSQLKKLKNTIQDSHNLLSYTYRWCLLKPCFALTAIEIFLSLFNEALKMCRNDIFEQEYLDVVTSVGKDPRYLNDDGFRDEAFMLYPRESSYICFFSQITTNSNIYRFKSYYNMAYRKDNDIITRYLEKNQEYISDIHNTILDNSIQEITSDLICDGCPLSISDIVFPKNDSNRWTHSVSISGRGGCGKTYQLLNMIDVIFSDFSNITGSESNKERFKSVIPFYLALNDINESTGNCVIKFVSRELDIKQSSLKAVLEKYKENVIIFCDGMNEVTNSDIRASISHSIKDIMGKFHTRIVLTSRIDHGDLFNNLGINVEQRFVKAEVVDLNPEQIQNYFNININNQEKVENYLELPVTMQELLKTAQGLTMYVALKNKDSSAEFENLGSLLKAYVDKILCINNLNYELILETIAYHMAKADSFQIPYSKLKSILDDESLKTVTSDANIGKIFYSKNHMKGKRVFVFSHQNFRDLYAGLFIKDQVENLSDPSDLKNIKDLVDQYFVNNGANESDEILKICSDFLESDSIQSAITTLKKSRIDDYSYALSILVKLYSFTNNYSISTLDLSDLDLTNISLSNYSLFNLLDGKSCNFTNSIICEDTFLINGLQNGCSTICKYDFEGCTFIAAFSATNVLTYNINKNIWNCYRNFKNHGWINCCCVSSLDGNIVVFLGTESGNITVFNPETHKIELLMENKGDSKNGIKSMTITKFFGNITILYSDEYGNVFMLEYNQGQLLRESSENEIVNAKNLYKKKSTEIFKNYLVFDKSLEIQSRLTVSKNNKNLYLCYANTIYRFELPIMPDKEFQVFMKFDDDTIVRDIFYTTGGILVNKLTEISFISDSGIEHSSFRFEDSETLEYFTKFSPTHDSNKALIGLSARYGDYSKIGNFFIVHYDRYSDKVVGDRVHRGRHSKTTHTGVPFVSPSEKKLIATVSDDRAVQIIAPFEEDAETIIHKGSYDGVREVYFINENEIILAQYDGSVSVWRKIYNRWECENVYSIHNDWVWNVKHNFNNKILKDDDDWKEFWTKNRNASYIFSCSYDGTIKKTNPITGISETSFTIRDPSHKPFIDLVIINNSNSVIGITDSTIYYKGLKEECSKTIPMEKDWSRYILRSIENVDDKVFIGLKAIKTNNIESCYIYSWSDRKKINFELACEKTCKLIADIRIFNVCNKKIMVIYGNSSRSQYFAFYLLDLDEAEWVYKGSICPDDDHKNNYNTNINLIDLNSEDYGSINDVAIWDKYHGSTSDKELKFEMYVVCKKCHFRAYEINIGNDHTTINEKKQEEITKITIAPYPSQPLCIDILNDKIVVGQLNGLVSTNNLNDITNLPVDFMTHANLNAGIKVNLANAKYKNPEEEQDFKKHFAGYFDFGVYN